jgi:hypothetical protein
VQNAKGSIDISPWEADEEFGVFPVGSKPKKLVRCPADAPYPFLIARHSYLFKKAQGRLAPQLWSEVIASRLAALVGLDVPPCFVAVDSVTGDVGALVEFFYGYPGEKETRELVPAADYLQERYGVGSRTDRPHNVQQNLELCQEYKVIDPVSWWARVLTFDALIGNTDRHPENWGFLKAVGDAGATPVWALTPPFDNGTSLGYEFPESQLRRFDDPVRLARYIDRGTHHCGWDASSDSPTPHLALCRRFFAAFPDTIAIGQEVIKFSPDQLQNIIEECVRFDVSASFTRDRARFVSALVEARKRQLSTIVGA